MAELTGLYVEVKGHDINRALRDLKKKVYRENIFVEYKRHMAYESPAVKRRRKHVEHLRRLRKEALEEQFNA